MGYDAVNRMTTYADAEDLASYAYDALGRRVAKTVGGVTTRYIYAGERVIEERDAAGNVRR